MAKRIGVLSVPWTAIPVRYGSVTKVAHEVIKPLSKQFDFVCVGGTSGHDLKSQVDNIKYYQINSRFDILVSQKLSGLIEKVSKRSRHPLHREICFPAFALKAANIFKQNECDIILIHQLPQWLPILRRKLKNAKLLLWAHTAEFVEEEKSLAHLLSYADGVIGCSNYIANRMLTKNGKLADHSHTIYNGFDPSKFCPKQNIKQNHETLLYIGKVIPEKGIHILVEAFRLLAKRRPNLMLRIVGTWERMSPSLFPSIDKNHLSDIEKIEGNYIDYLVNAAGEYTDRISISREIVNSILLSKEYQQCTLFIHPGLCEEAFGMPVVEAMASQKPVIVTTRGGLPELIEEGKSGLTFKSGSVHELAEKIEYLLVDRELRQSMAENAYHRAMESFTWDCSAKSLAELIRHYS